MRLRKTIENEIALKSRKLANASLVECRKINKEIDDLKSELDEIEKQSELNITTEKLRKITGDNKKIPSGQIVYQ